MSYKWLETASFTYPDHIAVKYNGETLTYQKLYMHAHSLGTHLQSLKKKRVGLYIDNSLDSVKLIHGLMLLGVEMVMLNTRLTALEMKSQLDDVSVDTVIATRSLEIPNINVIPFNEIYALPSETFMVNQPNPDDVLSIMFTSGTTGRAKAVPQTYRNHEASHLNCQKHFMYDETSSWLMVNPVFHISGLSILFRTVLVGCTLIVENKFNPSRVWHILEQDKVTHTSMVPVMLKRLMNSNGIHYLKGLLLGGASTTPHLLEQSIEKNLPVYNSFGMTETCSQIVQISYQDPKILSGAVGNVAGYDIKIKEKTDELLIKGDSVVKDYLNADLKLEDGYFNTGDLATIDADGYLYILDRRSDLIISGGENIYPKEIEDAVYMMADVNRCVVIKKDDEEWGSVPVLLLEDTVDETALLDHLSQQLAKYKMPREIHYVDKILMTSTGKISRSKNQKMFLEQ
ncbi:2-succinylbenzoate--CoA ligase [Jeotgalicoccus aerolatus]|uniref:Putative long chain fatty acid-CoA ligase VraA n=1 Tax=Jeotgalicoccus aerolatus TaxID=709510 RepID=A0ABS4HNW1_9STAP|nr:o-succinylbenzoate--CoA ligase [Jeotgalicoccus aerolatus]MBP1952621.1 O-succinylbenzoic acid--CoA ligase [Jeotgalicoccus aerolatus]GGD92130.1 2-succinylbenzoate--CoA ligase [Jeotgalicoccus aerolatus]CAD2074207.1 2-succinylbenzoate--CoA ligase [Jeotgalicoccus aerolatus]